MGLPYRVEADGVGVHDTLGLAIDAERGFIVNKADRMWRLRSALLTFADPGYADCDTVRIVIGHPIHACMVYRPVLMVFSEVYRFVAKSSNGP